MAFAQITGADPDDAFEHLRTLIGAAIAPGTAIERYGREWRMGQYRQRDSILVGRIGYQRPGELAELWDSAINDFRETRLVDGLTSPFALDLENLTLVFQLRAGRIKHTSFTGAFQALLNEASGETLWRVRPIVQGVTWERWRTSALRVRHIELRMERPNPNYHGRSHVQRIVEGTNARLARLVLDASGDDLHGLNIDDPIIREAIEHAVEDYGSVKAIGDVQGEVGVQESVWRSDREGSPIETRVPVDPDTREVMLGPLADELPHVPPGVVDDELRAELVAPPPPEDEGDE